MTSISKSTGIKILAGLLVASGIMTYGFKTHIAKAASNVAGLTGTYVCMTNRNFGPTAAWLTSNSSSNSQIGANTMAIIDFDKGTQVGFAYANLNWGNTGSGNSAPTAQVITFTGTFTMANGPVTGSYTILNSLTFALNGSSKSDTGSTNMIPANSGNTLFISSTAPSAGNNPTPETGVCQKQ
jgi:hypothetical protein